MVARMPRYPGTAQTVQGMEGSLFSKLAHRLATMSGERYPLHVGDTWCEPAEGCRMQDLDVSDYPGMHRYASPHGLPELLERIVARAETTTGVPTDANNVLVAAGATGALGATIGSTINPGEEVLILAPYWPLIAGVVQSFGGVPVAVPYIGAVEGADDVAPTLDAHLSERTAAIYVSTPNNPTGKIIPADQLAAICSWAEAHGLWIIADEVYEDYVYAGEHQYTRPLSSSRTFSVHSFSKAYGMAGNRCGYVVGPHEVMQELRKVSTHTFYSTPTASQIAAARALDGRGAAWVETMKPAYFAAGTAAAERLGVEPPEGSQFLWLDVAHLLDERGLVGFLEDCLDRGLLVAPGHSFGPYPTHIRVCFTCVAPDITARGIDVLAQMLER
ncbi:MAG: aminotransferase class I/II-fold pyridoxal phosphate-dependent enzyme [Acidobacteria bacterium]|nr:aminotransferase class I/II-fold pyridoxal phosphate-dependent enzyme [Acidobacteriota bacterium]